MLRISARCGVQFLLQHSFTISFTIIFIMCYATSTIYCLARSRLQLLQELLSAWDARQCVQPLLDFIETRIRLEDTDIFLCVDVWQHFFNTLWHRLIVFE